MKTIYIILLVLVITIGITIAGFLVVKYTVDNPSGELESDLFSDCLVYNCPKRTQYVGSINSDKYYVCDCRYARSVNLENIVCFRTDEEAIADGRTKSEC